MRSRKHGHRAIRFPEPLEARAMLSGNGLSPFAHLAQQFAESGGQSTTAFVASEHAGCGSDSGSTDSTTDSSGDSSTSSQRTTLTATLSDASNSAVTGTASYTTKTTDGVTTTKLSVSISGADANSTLDVAIDGTVVGQLTTDDTGAGSLVLSSDPTGTEQSLPDNFPDEYRGGFGDYGRNGERHVCGGGGFGRWMRRGRAHEVDSGAHGFDEHGNWNGDVQGGHRWQLDAVLSDNDGRDGE